MGIDETKPADETAAYALPRRPVGMGAARAALIRTGKTAGETESRCGLSGERTEEGGPRTERDLIELEWLMDYELSLALRHQRHVSLVLLTEARGEPGLRVLEGIVRRSDEFFLLRAEAAILMSETNKAGALKAVARFMAACEGRYDLRVGVATYPMDGRLSGGLLHAARRRLNQARGSQRDAVIDSD